MGGEPLADHATHGQAAPVDALKRESLEYGERVAAEALHRVGTLGAPGFAVAVPVVAHKPEVPREPRDLPVPHVQGRA